MTSIGDVVAGLRTVAERLVVTGRHLRAAAVGLAEATTNYLSLLAGSTDPAVDQLLALFAAGTHHLRHAEQLCSRAGAAVEALIRHYEGDAGPPPTEAGPAGDTVRAPDGSRYPAAAAWCVDELPRRVRELQPREKTIGYVDGALIPFTSGIDGTWSPSIVRRLTELGVRRLKADYLRAHVEMKVATMMIQEGRRHSELTINHVPCGSQPRQRNGCHQILELYLPRGCTLTVHGTTQQGEPFSHTYRGRA